MGNTESTVCKDVQGINETLSNVLNFPASNVNPCGFTQASKTVTKRLVFKDPTIGRPIPNIPSQRINKLYIR